MSMLPLVIYITYGTISNWKPLKTIQLGGSLDLVPVSYYLDSWFKIRFNIFSEVYPCYGNGVFLVV